MASTIGIGIITRLIDIWEKDPVDIRIAVIQIERELYPEGEGVTRKGFDTPTGKDYTLIVITDIPDGILINITRTELMLITIITIVTLKEKETIRIKIDITMGSRGDISGMITEE